MESLLNCAIEVEKEIDKGIQKRFKRVINAHIGDAQAMGQRPITFIRQVIACIALPELIEKGDFPSDVKQRAKDILDECGGGSVGAYTSSLGIDSIRRHVAEYIARRDGHPAHWQDIFLCAGASNAIQSCLELFRNTIDGKPSGVLVPVPRHPLYSTVLAHYGLVQVGYYLDEDHNWALSTEELQRALEDGRSRCAVRALVVINPGNPTGQVLTRENIEEVVKFAYKHNLFVFADEVYQDNVYAKESKFYSFKKVVRDLGPPYSEHVGVASFMSMSGGYAGECGLRCGWAELANVEARVKDQLYKCINATICPDTLGQAVVDCVAKPPVQGEPSYELWTKEKAAVLQSLDDRARMIADTFNQIKGVDCNFVQGAIYAFPRIELPIKAIEVAKAVGQPADVFYACKLLNETGIFTIPGSIYGQKPGKFHFRTTILPQPALLKEMLQTFKQFHEKFTKEYS